MHPYVLKVEALANLIIKWKLVVWIQFLWKDFDILC